MTEYKKFSEQPWKKFGTDILREKGSEKQKEFLRSCKSGKDTFLEYVSNIYPVGDSITGNQKIDFKRKFSESEFINPPSDTQQVIWDAFNSISDEEAVSCGFWGYVVITMINDDCIQPKYLAAQQNSINKTGEHMIDEALKSQDSGKIDSCARRILRSMCNSAPRDKRIVFNDFHLGKTYWRWCWAQRMSKSISLEFEKILEIFDEKYYAELAAKMHSGMSFISAENIFGGLLLYLNEVNSVGDENKKMKPGALVKIINRISYLSAWKAIEVQKPIINKEEIQQIAKDLSD